MGNIQKMNKAKSEKLQKVLDLNDTWSLILVCLRSIFPPQTKNLYSDGSIFYELSEPLLPYIAQSQAPNRRQVLDYFALPEFPLERIKLSLEHILQLLPDVYSVRLLKKYIDSSKYGKAIDNERIAACLLPHLHELSGESELRGILVVVFGLASFDWDMPKASLIARSMSERSAKYLIDLLIDFVPLVHRYTIPYSFVLELIQRLPALGPELLLLLHRRKCYSLKNDDLYREQSAFLYEYATEHPEFWPIFVEIDMYAAWERLKSNSCHAQADIKFVKSLVKYSIAARICDQVMEWILSNADGNMEYQRTDIEELAVYFTGIHGSMAGKIVQLVAARDNFVAHLLLWAIIISFKALPETLVADVEKGINGAKHLRLELEMALASRTGKSVEPYCPFGDGSKCEFNVEHALGYLEWLPALCKASFLEELFTELLLRHLSKLIEFMRCTEFYCLPFVRKPFLHALEGMADSIKLRIAQVVHRDFLTKSARKDLLKVLMNQDSDELCILRLIKKSDCKEDRLVELYIDRQAHASVALFAKFLSAAPNRVQSVAKGKDGFYKVLYQHCLKHKLESVLEYEGSDLLVWDLYVKATGRTGSEGCELAASPNVLGSESEEALIVKLTLHPESISAVSSKALSSRVLLELLRPKTIAPSLFDYVHAHFYDLFGEDDLHSWNSLKILIQKRKEFALPVDFVAKFLCSRNLDNEDAMLCVRSLIVLRFKEIYKSLPVLLGRLPVGTHRPRVAHLLHRVLAEDLVHRKRCKAVKYLVAPALLLTREYMRGEAASVQVFSMNLRTLVSLIEVFSKNKAHFALSTGKKRRRKRQAGPGASLLDVMSKWSFHEPKLQVQLRLLKEKTDLLRKKRRLEQNY